MVQEGQHFDQAELCEELRDALLVPRVAHVDVPQHRLGPRHNTQQRPQVLTAEIVARQQQSREHTRGLVGK